MTYWLAVRGSRSCAAVAIVTLTLLVLVGDLAVPVLSLAILSEIALPVSLVAPVGLAVVLAWSLGHGDERLEGIAVRPMRLLDTLYAAAVSATFAAAASAIDILGLADLGVEAARNAVGLVGLMLVGRWLIGAEVAAVIPAVYVLMVGFFAGETSDAAAWWAWLVRPVDDPTTWMQVLVLFVLACTLSLSGRRLAPALR